MAASALCCFGCSHHHSETTSSSFHRCGMEVTHNDILVAASDLLHQRSETATRTMRTQAGNFVESIRAPESKSDVASLSAERSHCRQDRTDLLEKRDCVGGERRP